MKENNKIYKVKKFKDSVLFYTQTTNKTISKFEADYKYFLSRNFIKEYVGTFSTGYFFSLDCNLNLKELKMEFFN